MFSSESVCACLSLLNAGSMRFRWNEQNTNRNIFFENICGKEKQVVPLELIHSKIVFAVDTAAETEGLQADGIITCNKNLVPVLTVADCMPLFLWDKNTGCFGVLHSGWKGTGIVTEALRLAKEKYGANASDFSVVIGPHIKNCCYIVDEERAMYFASNFTSNCVELLNEKELTYRLSLEKANVFLLEEAGVKTENITVAGRCTCCTNDGDGKDVYGSFRRETAHFPPNSPIKEMQKSFTPMAAFMYVDNKPLESNAQIFVHSL